jgi:hypothetical protein
MLRRDQRFVPEKNEIGRKGIARVLFFSFSFIGVCALGLGGARYAVSLINDDKDEELVVMEPIKEGWKRAPDNPGGRAFLNKGLEINHVQAKLFDLPIPEEIVLAPPPESF